MTPNGRTELERLATVETEIDQLKATGEKIEASLERLLDPVHRRVPWVATAYITAVTSTMVGLAVALIGVR